MPWLHGRCRDHAGAFNAVGHWLSEIKATAAAAKLTNRHEASHIAASKCWQVRVPRA
jgi:hypothetical protein